MGRDMDIGIPPVAETFREALEGVLGSEVRSIRDSVAELVVGIEERTEWDIELTDQLIDKLETLRAATASTGTGVDSVVTGLEDVVAAVEAASTAAVSSASDRLTELQDIGATSKDINEVLDKAIKELERLRKIAGLIGEEVD